MIREHVEPRVLVVADDHARAGLLELRVVRCRVFSATMCTTEGETALETSSNIRLTCPNCSYSLAS